MVISLAFEWDTFFYPAHSLLCGGVVFLDVLDDVTFRIVIYHERWQKTKLLGYTVNLADVGIDQVSPSGMLFLKLLYRG